MAALLKYFSAYSFITSSFIIFFFLLYQAPTVPPTSITTFHISSTSLRVTWNKIPTEQVIGRIKGYSILFFAVKDGNSTVENVTLENGDINETSLVNLQKYTQYSIQVLGFTEFNKIGPLSSPIYAMTDQDGKKKFNFRTVKCYIC